MQVCDNIQRVHKSGDLVWGQPSKNPGQPKIVPSPEPEFLVNPCNHKIPGFLAGKKFWILSTVLINVIPNP